CLNLHKSTLFNVSFLLYLSSCATSTHATSNLGNWLNLKLVLYLEDLAYPNNGLNLVPNPF
ncbi:hypothetical protein, partial [Flavobacterium chungangense]|uniref:hypothetical protein n=1 Tax=Flavobacterium chungangense TaxID=554283 RepID=UPI001C6085DA